MSSIIAHKTDFPHCCGLNVIGGFSGTGPDAGNLNRLGSSGTGMLVATFTDTPTQRTAYEELKQKYDILFQSKPTTNRYSKNKVILVVYGKKKRTKKKEGESTSWPMPTERRGEKLPAFSG